MHFYRFLEACTNLQKTIDFGEGRGQLNNDKYLLCCQIYTRKFSNNVRMRSQDARMAGDNDKAYELIAENMKLFGISREKQNPTIYGNEDNIIKTINSRFSKI
jgi:hypothetical protein